MPTDPLFPEILELNRRAVDAQTFEVAYHLLAAALHAAADDVEGINRVMALALQQGEALDARFDHAMSSERAAHRGNEPMYQSLATNAEAKLAQVRAERARTDLRRVD